MLVSDLNRSNGVALPPLDKWQVRQCRAPSLACSLPAVHAPRLLWFGGYFASGLFYVAVINPQPVHVCFFHLLGWLGCFPCPVAFIILKKVRHTLKLKGDLGKLPEQESGIWAFQALRMNTHWRVRLREIK